MSLCRQTNPYSCGPAAIVAAAMLQGRACDFSIVTNELNPDPVCGTGNDELLASASHYLDLSQDQSKWHGGLAIANIRNPDSGVGHYVVMLGLEGDTFRYYCPLRGKIITLLSTDLVWTNGAGTLVEWVINLQDSDTKTLGPVDGDRFVFIIGDRIEGLDPNIDTSLVLMEAYQQQNIPVFWVLDTSIALIGDTLFLNGLPVNERDLVWIRLDPVNTVRYYEILRLLVQVKNVTFLNSPEAILLRHDKLSSSQHRKNSMIVSVTSESEALRGLRHLDWRYETSKGYVVKSPSRFGGKTCAEQKTMRKLYPLLLTMFKIRVM